MNPNLLMRRIGLLLRLAFSNAGPLLVSLCFLAGCQAEPEVESVPQAEGPEGAAPAAEKSAEVEGSPEFTVLVYNVENLFDVDGVALFDDYTEENGYGPPYLLSKVRSVVTTVQAIDGGEGPDIILFQEFEGDQTPSEAGEVALKMIADGTFPELSEVLTGEGDVPARFRDLPAYAWVAAGLAEAGLAYPHIVSAEYDPPPSADDGPVHANATFSRFPITRTVSHPLMRARSILETEIEVHGHPVVFFNNHWKSGAGRVDMETIRLQNASILRKRLDEVLADDPDRDVVLAGDFNSHYNQRSLFPEWPRTGINDVLGSQGDELAIREADTEEPLYNLWFELPFEKRGSELYRGHWGTLMQILLTRGLYDRQGVQYVDQSFEVVVLPGVNAEPLLGAPFRWIAIGDGAGFSDHFPLLARFRVVGAGEPGYVDLNGPSRQRRGPANQPEGRFDEVDLTQARDLSEFGSLEAVRAVENLGQLVRVEGTLQDGRRMMIDSQLGLIELWIPDRDYREKFREAYRDGSRVEFHGLIGWFRGRWQIELAHPSWGPSI